MVIAKPEWFKRRKYSGWGVTPKTWQGRAYLIVIMSVFFIFQILPYWDVQARIIFTGAWLLFLMIDISDVMIRMKKDEREKIHEAIAERNALWIMVLVLVIGILYQLLMGALKQRIEIDWFIVVALFFGLIVKTASNLYLDRKN